MAMKLAAACAAMAGAGVALGIASGANAASTEKLLYTFSGGNDGGSPMAGLAKDNAGNFYGTSEFGGADSFGNVFELSPGKKGGWAYKVIYTFTGSYAGVYPECALTFDGKGNLYCTSVFGGESSMGAVFELSPGQNGQWSLAKYYDFTGPDGESPAAGVVLDAAGNLFGTTEAGGQGNGGYGYGTIYELSPSGNGWAEHTVYQFTGGNDGAFPKGSLILDRAGNLYGTAPYGGTGGGEGVAFEFSQSKKHKWTESVLYNFTGGTDGQQPSSYLIFDGAGNLYGTTAGNYGTVFKLSPSGQSWTLTTLFDFGTGAGGNSPYSGLLFDKAGNLYGATVYGGAQTCQNGCGVIYQLTPSQGGPWAENVLLGFTGSNGATPFPTLVLGRGGRLYGTTYNGGKGSGVIFSVKP